MRETSPETRDSSSSARGNSGYRRKFNSNIDQGKTNLVRVSGKFELSEFGLSRFYCTSLTVENNNTTNFQHFFSYERLLVNFFKRF